MAKGTRFIRKEDTNIKTEKNFNRLFKILEKEFPGWVSLPYINKKYKLNFVFESDLEELHKDGFLSMAETHDPRALEKGDVIKRKNYRLNANGFNFINSLNVQKTNTLLLILTILLTLIGFTQIFIMLSHKSLINSSYFMTSLIPFFVLIIMFFLFKLGDWKKTKTNRKFFILTLSITLVLFVSIPLVLAFTNKFILEGDVYIQFFPKDGSLSSSKEGWLVYVCSDDNCTIDINCNKQTSEPEIKLNCFNSS